MYHYMWKVICQRGLADNQLVVTKPRTQRNWAKHDILKKFPAFILIDTYDLYGSEMYELLVWSLKSTEKCAGVKKMVSNDSKMS